MSDRGRHVSETPATRFLRARGVRFDEHPYDYVDRGGTSESARQLGVSEHVVFKTLVMQDDRARPLIVLMHGDRAVSTKALARQIGVKSVEPCDPAQAQRHTGYLVGGTSPFGLRKALPVYHEDTMAAIERVFLNGGRRGYLVSLPSAQIVELLGSTSVHCAIDKA
jgi:Cys-tRNA(Pro) deacylase